jgi:hypothetical protein
MIALARLAMAREYISTSVLCKTNWVPSRMIAAHG